MLFVRGRILPEARNPVNRVLIWLYRPMIRLVLRARLLTIADRPARARRHGDGRSCGSARNSCRRSTRAR